MLRIRHPDTGRDRLTGKSVVSNNCRAWAIRRCNKYRGIVSPNRCRSTAPCGLGPCLPPRPVRAPSTIQRSVHPATRPVCSIAMSERRAGGAAVASPAIQSNNSCSNNVARAWSVGCATGCRSAQYRPDDRRGTRDARRRRSAKAIGWTAPGLLWARSEYINDCRRSADRTVCSHAPPRLSRRRGATPAIAGSCKLRPRSHAGAARACRPGKSPRNGGHPASIAPPWEWQEGLELDSGGKE